MIPEERKTAAARRPVAIRSIIAGGNSIAGDSFPPASIAHSSSSPHHSDGAFTISTALRFHPGELLPSLPLRLAAVIALGASPAAVVTFEILFAVANLAEHGDIDLPRPIERAVGRVCITPALRVETGLPGMSPTVSFREALRLALDSVVLGSHRG